MDWTTIIVALIAFAGSAIGTFSGYKLISYRVEQLEKKVDKHNGFAEKIPVMTEKLKRAEQDIEALKKGA